MMLGLVRRARDVLMMNLATKSKPETKGETSETQQLQRLLGNYDGAIFGLSRGYAHIRCDPI